jgi:hypothetical protein
MPVTVFTKPLKGGNKGSVRAFVSYLSKEDKKRDNTSGQDREYFFTQNSDRVPAALVIQAMDGSWKGKGLSRSEDKFFTGVTALSQAECRHLEQNPGLIREVIRRQMQAYAEAFNKELKADDLVWFAKVEHTRRYKGDDPEVQTGSKASGQAKEGVHIHVHWMVGRCDRHADNRRSYSPMINDRRGFDRKRFLIQCDHLFDAVTGFRREQLTGLALHEQRKNKRDQTKNIKSKQYKQNLAITPLQDQSWETKRAEQTLIERKEVEKLAMTREDLKNENKDVQARDVGMLEPSLQSTPQDDSIDKAPKPDVHHEPKRQPTQNEPRPAPGLGMGG